MLFLFMAVSACLINDDLEQDTDLWYALHVTLDSPADAGPKYLPPPPPPRLGVGPAGVLGLQTVRLVRKVWLYYI